MCVCVETQLAGLKLAGASEQFLLHNETSISQEETALFLAINQLNLRSWEVKEDRGRMGGVVELERQEGC